MKMTEEEKTELYEEYSIKVRNFILSKVNDFHLAEDLTAEVFVKVYDKLDTYDKSKSSLSTWIFTITRHHLIDYYRTRKVNVELPEDLTYEDEDDETLCTEENIAILREGLKRLNIKERNVIILHYYSKMTLKDVAKKMGISYAYVKLLHAKALLHLKTLFPD